MGSCAAKLHDENKLKRTPNKNKYIHIFSDDNNISKSDITKKIDATTIKQIFIVHNPQTILIHLNDGSIYYGKNKYTYFEDNGIIINRIYIPKNIENNDKNIKSTFWMTDDGSLYKGDLRNGTPSKIEIGDITASIVDISSGSKHDIVLCGNGTQLASIDLKDVKRILSYYVQNTKIAKFSQEVITCIYEYCQQNVGTKCNEFMDTNLYSLGKGEYGQTGQGEGDGEYKTDEELALIAKDWKFINPFKNITVTSISCGEKFTLFLDCNGIVYGCGANGYGQLGLGEQRNYTDSTAPPTIIPYFIENEICIKDIECGQRHSLALDINHNIYGWGSNYFKQCGFDQGGEIKIPRMIDIFRKYNIMEISCAGCNSYAKSDKNDHVIWGNNEYGQCLDAKCRCCMPAKINNTFHSMTSKQINSVYLSMNCVIITCKD